MTVNGLSQIDESLVLDAAEDAGLRIGSFLPSVDMQVVADHILETIPGVGYCAVNKIGSHVEIESTKRHRSRPSCRPTRATSSPLKPEPSSIWRCTTVRKA